jgi:hypothetical protein
MAKLGKLGNFQEAEVVETPAIEKTVETPIVETVEVPPTVEVNSDGALKEVVQETPATEVIDDHSSTFTIDFEEEKSIEQPKVEQQASPITDWKEALKKIDLKEIAKELGISEFALEINEHIKNGGNAADYLGAKAIDWGKVSHQDLIISDLKSQYPHLSDDKIHKLFEKRYSQSEFLDEDEKEVGLIQLEADAENIRNKRIVEQGKFKLPEAVPHQIDEQVNQRIAQLQQENLKQIQQNIDYLSNHESTKNLLTSKRVVSKYGENGAFNFNIDKPELILKVLTDDSVWGKITSTKEGTPNVELLQEMALFALNPIKFKTDLVNHGKSLGAKGFIDEGKNATRNIATTPSSAHQEKPTYKQSSFGR